MASYEGKNFFLAPDGPNGVVKNDKDVTYGVDGKLPDTESDITHEEGHTPEVFWKKGEEPEKDSKDSSIAA
ncbi:MAG: hypothetical protein WCJ25_01305 [Candidatus Moraniibacteriota bacterium]